MAGVSSSKLGFGFGGRGRGLAAFGGFPGAGRRAVEGLGPAAGVFARRAGRVALAEPLAALAAEQEVFPAATGLAQLHAPAVREGGFHGRGRAERISRAHLDGEGGLGAPLLPADEALFGFEPASDGFFGRAEILGLEGGVLCGLAGGRRCGRRRLPGRSRLRLGLRMRCEEAAEVVLWRADRIVHPRSFPAYGAAVSPLVSRAASPASFSITV